VLSDLLYFLSFIAKSGISLKALDLFMGTSVCSAPLNQLSATMDNMSRNGHIMAASEIKNFVNKVASHSLNDVKLLSCFFRGGNLHERGLLAGHDGVSCIKSTSEHIF
jgi:hypothetical protein